MTTAHGGVGPEHLAEEPGGVGEHREVVGEFGVEDLAQLVVRVVEASRRCEIGAEEGHFGVVVRDRLDEGDASRDMRPCIQRRLMSWAP